MIPKFDRNRGVRGRVPREDEKKAKSTHIDAETVWRDRNDSFTRRNRDGLQSDGAERCDEPI